MTESETHQLPTDAVVVGDTLIYPCQVGWPVRGIKFLPQTVSYIVEYPENRVFYFEEGGYAVVGRKATLTKVDAAPPPVTCDVCFADLNGPSCTECLQKQLDES